MRCICVAFIRLQQDSKVYMYVYTMVLRLLQLRVLDKYRCWRTRRICTHTYVYIYVYVCITVYMVLRTDCFRVTWRKPQRMPTGGGDPHLRVSRACWAVSGWRISCGSWPKSRFPKRWGAVHGGYGNPWNAYDIQPFKNNMESQVA